MKHKFGCKLGLIIDHRPTTTTVSQPAMSGDDNSNMGMNTVVAPGPTSGNDGSVVNTADSFEAAIPVVAQQQGTFAVCHMMFIIFLLPSPASSKSLNLPFLTMIL